MKRFFVMGKQIMLAAVLFAGLSLTSCDKDDPEPDQPNNEQPTPTPNPDPDPNPTPNPDPDPDPTPTPDPTPAANKALHITQAKVDGYWLGQLLSAIQLEEGSYTLTAKVYTKTDLVLRTSFADLDNGEDQGFDCIATNFTGSEEAQDLSVDFTLTKAAADFKLWFGNQDCDFWIDDMVLVKKDDTKNLFKFSDFSGENDLNFWRNQYNHELTFEIADLPFASAEPTPEEPKDEPVVEPETPAVDAVITRVDYEEQWNAVEFEYKEGWTSFTVEFAEKPSDVQFAILCDQQDGRITAYTGMYATYRPIDGTTVTINLDDCLTSCKEAVQNGIDGTDDAKKKDESGVSSENAKLFKVNIQNTKTGANSIRIKSVKAIDANGSSVDLTIPASGWHWTSEVEK